MGSIPTSRWTDSVSDTVRHEDKARKKKHGARKRNTVVGKKETLVEEEIPPESSSKKNQPGAKRIKLSSPSPTNEASNETREVLENGGSAPSWKHCTGADGYEQLNAIEEGSYGWVIRARNRRTGNIVALKKLKMDHLNVEGMPITGLREIDCLLAVKHRHIVALQEIVVGSQLDQVYLVMDFLQHDLKSLSEEMSQPFSPSETKTIMLQLLSAVKYLHDNWILHRDLKTSNILMNNHGEIKVADFGMARYFGMPLPQMTQLVVTLWYRAPELLLGTESYDQTIDIWSVGCIFGELLVKQPLLQGKTEVSQLASIFELCGVPNENTWPGFRRLPHARSLRIPPSQQERKGTVTTRFASLSENGMHLLTSLLSLNPAKRPSADYAQQHPYFEESPRPKNAAMFPTFPSKASQEMTRRRMNSSPPKPGRAANIDSQHVDFHNVFDAMD